MIRFKLFLICGFGALLLGCGAAPKAPRDARSNNFDVAAQYLDLGGDVYMFVDMEGDVEKGAELINDLIAVVDEIPPEYKSRFNAVKIAKALGMTDVHAMGMSSYEQDDRYINKTFIKTAYPRTGMLKYYGGEPHPFEILDLAPTDALIAYEHDINLHAVLETLYAVLGEILEDDAMAEINSHLDTEIAPGTMTYRALAEQLNTKLMGVVVVHPTRKIRIPDTQVEVPYIDAFIAADNMGPFMDILVQKSKELPILSVWEDDQWQRLGVAEFLTDELLNYRPVIWREKATDRVYIATSSQFLEERLKGQNSLRTDETFVSLSTNVPVEQGNSLFYVSPEVFNYMRESVDKALAKKEKLSSLRKMVDVLSERVSPGQLWMSRNTPDGIYQVSNSSFSHKSTFVASLYMNQLYGLSMLGGVLSYVAEQAMRDVVSGLVPKNEIPLPEMTPEAEERIEPEIPEEYPSDEMLEREYEKKQQEKSESPKKPKQDIPDYFEQFIKNWRDEQKENQI